MEKSIFEIITEYAVNEGVDETLMQDAEYRQVQEKIGRLEETIATLGLTEEQRLIVDNLAALYGESGSLYGEFTYQRGFRDCASLLLEIGAVK